MWKNKYGSSPLEAYQITWKQRILVDIAIVYSYLCFKTAGAGIAQSVQRQDDSVDDTNFESLSFIIKRSRCTRFPNLLRHETLHVSGSSSAHHQEFIHCTLRTGICHTGLRRAFEKDQDGTAVPSWSCSKAAFKPVWHIPVRSVQWINSWWWAEELPETCSVSYRSKFGKRVRLVGFIIKKFVTMRGNMKVKFESLLGQDIYLFPKISWPSLKPHQSHIRWVTGTVSPMGKWRRR